jgi:hypothetical protein
MGNVVDIADMKQRVAATEAKLGDASREGREHNARILGLLEAVEKTLEHNQQQIRRLKRAGKALAVFGLMSWLATGALVADKVHSGTLNDALNGTLLRSQPGNASAKLAPIELQAHGTSAVSVAAQASEPEVPQVAVSEGLASTLEADLASSETVMRSSETNQATIRLPELGQAPQRPFSAPPSGAAAPGTELAFVATPSFSDEVVVSRLLELAQNQVANMAFTTPKGDNAYETFQLILSSQPNNEAALSGIEQIGVKYVELANLAAAKGDLRMANHYAAKASELAPEHPIVLGMAFPMEAERRPTEETTSSSAASAEIKRPRRPPAQLQKVAARDEMVFGPSAAPQSLIEDIDDLVFKPHNYRGRQVVVIGSVNRFFWRYRLRAETGQNSIVLDVDGLRQADRSALESAIETSGLLGQVRARIKGRIERQSVATFRLVASELVLVDSRLRPVSLGSDRQG